MTASDRHEQLREAVYAFGDLMVADLPEPEWLIPQWLVNEPTIVAGRPKTFKSTFAMEMAVALTSGTAFLDEAEWTPNEPMPVVYLMEENSAGSTRALIQDIVERKRLGQLKQRADGSLVWEGDEIPLYLLAREGFKLEDDWVAAVIDFCQEVGAKVVVIDAWYRVLPHGVEAKSGTDLAPVFDRLQEFGKLEDPITTIMVAHTNKGSSSIRSDRGGVGIMDSTYIEAFFEGFVLTYYADTQALGSVDVRRFFRNKGQERDVTVTLNDEHDRRHGWTWSEFESVGDKQTNVTAALKERFIAEYPKWKEEGMTQAAMRNLLTRSDTGKRLGSGTLIKWIREVEDD
jgi:hypothetical protein